MHPGLGHQEPQVQTASGLQNKLGIDLSRQWNSKNRQTTIGSDSRGWPYDSLSINHQRAGWTARCDKSHDLPYPQNPYTESWRGWLWDNPATHDGRKRKESFCSLQSSKKASQCRRGVEPHRPMTRGCQAAR